MRIRDEEPLHEEVTFEFDGRLLDPQSEDFENPSDDLEEADLVAGSDHEAGEFGGGIGGVDRYAGGFGELDVISGGGKGFRSEGGGEDVERGFGKRENGERERAGRGRRELGMAGTEREEGRGDCRHGGYRKWEKCSHQNFSEFRVFVLEEGSRESARERVSLRTLELCFEALFSTSRV